ncbi:MAG: hypothetical protein DI539_21235 [Flavobacterium psychrophilum]|nr:MAG: hypothetical protein DI539_21235 [Flavobacterium psychrophilum]
MTQDIAHPILQKAIQGLNVSKEFKAMAKANGYKTLQNILDHPLHELPFKKLSGYRMLKELLDIFNENELEHLLDGLDN